MKGLGFKIRLTQVKTRLLIKSMLSQAAKVTIVRSLITLGRNIIKQGLRQRKQEHCSRGHLLE
jgi:hypothetical protein